MPNSFAETDDGSLLTADGFGPVLAWDGFSPQARLAGVPKPTTAPTLAGSGNGTIVGTYVAFVRFLDSQRRPSDLSPASTETLLVGNTGGITGAGATSPILITTATNHGLATGNKVTITGVRGQTGANGVFTITVVSANSFTLDSSTAATSAYTGGGTWEAGLASILYTHLPTSSDPRVAHVQIFRNTDGQAETFYLDVEYNDPLATSTSTFNTDTDLQANESLTISDANGNDLANLYAEPPQSKCFLLSHQGRMHYAGEVEYAEGAVALTLGSTSVRGIGTEWQACVAGRFLYVVNADQRYEVSSVDVVNQTLVLTTQYLGATAPYAHYSIRPAPAEERLVYFSEAGMPEAVPVLNSYELPDDGDTITGLISKNSWVWITERRHVYRFTCDKDPIKDGEVFLDISRGCINDRSVIITEDAAFMLDEKGIHKFDSSQDPGGPVTTAISTIFRHDADGPRVNWAASRFFHSVYDPATEVCRFFISLSGQYLPRHCLAYQYVLDRWWVEEYSVPIGASTIGKLARNASLNTWGVGRPQVFYGSSYNRVLAFNSGRLDGVDQNGGVVSAAVASASQNSLTAPLGSAFGSDVVGSPVVITEGTGAGQRRMIVSATTNTLRLKTPWLVLPDATSRFIVGGVQWNYKTGWMRWATDENSNERNIELQFRPTDEQQKIILRRMRDRVDEPVPAPISRNDDGVRMVKDSGDLLVDLNRASGFALSRIEGSKETWAHGPRLISVELAGVGGTEPTEIYQITVNGASQ